MKTRKLISGVAAFAIAATTVGAFPAFALDWKDGAPANYHFTYNGAGEGVVSVTACDTNSTFNGEVKVGDTITTKTGTIAWRDSYTNTTTFTVNMQPGYKLVGLEGNVGDAAFTKTAKNTYTFQFTDKGAEAWCYGDDVDFTLVTEKTMYTITFVGDDGQEMGFITASLGEPLEGLDESFIPVAEGYTFDSWQLADGTVLPNAFTADVLAFADENNNINVFPHFTVNNYDVHVNYYNDNTQGQPARQLDTDVTYGEKLDDSYLNGYKVVGGKLPVVTGDTTIDLVKYTPVAEEFWGYDYGFLYNSKTDDIQSVEYSIDGSDWTGIDMNEGVKLSTDKNLKGHTITFRVKVADGKQLVLDSNGGNEVFTDGEYYTFSFTRTAHQGLNDSNVANVSFGLSAQ